MESNNILLYTIGHGNRTIEEFIQLLQYYSIAFLVDVRSQPYSRHNPQFSRSLLEKSLSEYSIRYLYMGNTLGGRPSDESCYIDDKVDYALVSTKSFYQQGIQRLRTAWAKRLRVAIMCSELKPQECHRSKLIGNTLFEQHIDVSHIDEKGALKTQEELNLMLSNGQLSLFDDVPLIEQSGKIGRSRKRYTPRDEVK